MTLETLIDVIKVIKRAEKCLDGLPESDKEIIRVLAAQDYVERLKYEKRIYDMQEECLRKFNEKKEDKWMY